jgi:3-hydroxyisobutyrate dehydrogenase
MRVGFIGIGAIGWPVAGTLIKAGHDVTVFDTDRDRVARFAAEFECRTAGGLAEIATNEFVIVMLPTGEIVRHVLTAQDNGAFRRGVRAGTIVKRSAPICELLACNLSTRRCRNESRHSPPAESQLQT